MFAVVLDSGPSHKQLNAPRGSETCKSAELFGFSVLANTQYGEKCCGKAMATSQSTWKLRFKGNRHYLVKTTRLCHAHVWACTYMGSSWQCQQDTALWHPCLKPTAAKTLYQVTQRKRCDLKTLLHQTCLRANIWSPQNKIDLFSAPQKFREIQASTAKTWRWQNFGTPLTGIFVSRHQLNSG